MDRTTAPAAPYRVENISQVPGFRLRPPRTAGRIWRDGHELVVQTGDFNAVIANRSPYLRACLHARSPRGGLTLLGVITSNTVLEAGATMGDLQNLLQSVALKACMDCSRPFIENPARPFDQVCMHCMRLRRVRLAGRLLLSEQETIDRRLVSYERANLEGVTHVIIRRKLMELPLERLVRLPAQMRRQLCSLESYRYTRGEPDLRDVPALFAQREQELEAPSKAWILPLHEYHALLRQRMEAIRPLVWRSKGMTERAGELLLEDIERRSRPVQRPPRGAAQQHRDRAPRPTAQKPGEQADDDGLLQAYMRLIDECLPDLAQDEPCEQPAPAENAA